ncbi:uncharacterized protein HaLaN_20480 [Haematococcus lacustris]|uniref:CCHC-type domain-containing protein n=1 Tax=Haematococcus lacustris TaxID=44745 RepID=A0A699ZKY9_HAELA|nr:uncharacterized protein HaLaN_20480 [Haematococcus lacustris]
MHNAVLGWDTSLRANDMWTNTIGLEQDPQAGSNSVIEAQIYAPTHGGGGKRTERRELAQQLIQASGYQPSVTDYQGLLTLAKAQGSLGVGARGACKLCGGLGHLTKQCTNYLTGHNASDGAAVVGLAGPAAAAGALPQGRGLLPDPSELTIAAAGSAGISCRHQLLPPLAGLAGSRCRQAASGSGCAWSPDT